MLIIGGVGQLYGAFIGVPLYMIAQDRFATIDPVYWYFWIGLFMIFVVVFARGGVPSSNGVKPPFQNVDALGHGPAHELSHGDPLGVGGPLQPIAQGAQDAPRTSSG